MSVRVEWEGEAVGWIYAVRGFWPPSYNLAGVNDAAGLILYVKNGDGVTMPSAGLTIGRWYEIVNGPLAGRRFRLVEE